MAEPSVPGPVHPRLDRFVAQVHTLLARHDDEASIVAGVRHAMAELVAHDDWLPEQYAQPHPLYYQQYLLHRDPQSRFSVVSFVWGPGQQTPVHDHTVWGVIGMLRGSERCTSFAVRDGRVQPAGATVILHPGEVECVSPTLGDVHRVANAHADRVSISVHCYGADIGTVRRHVFDEASGAVKEFVSGYANA